MPDYVSPERLEEICREIGTIIGDSLPDGIGFALSLFDFGADGNFAYISNGNRGDLIRSFRETIAHLERQ